MLLKVIVILFTALTSDAVRLDCVYSIGNNELTVDRPYKCEATIQSIGDYRTVSNVSQNHLPGRNNMLVNMISIQNQMMRYFLFDLHEFFPNLEIIKFQNVELEEFSTNELKEFPRLKELHFNQNKIQTLDRTVFEGNQGLRVIKLSSNPLRHVADHVFESLPELRWLEIINSTCINLNIVNNRDQILIQSFNIFQQCPPTSQMVAEVILDLPEFQQRIQSLVEDKVNEILETKNLTDIFDIVSMQDNRLEAVEDVAVDLERRVEDLDAQNPDPGYIQLNP